MYSQIPSDDVSSLPSNFFINKLLSELDGQYTTSIVWTKHTGKKLKLLCQTCDQLICKDCTVIDHRDHDYKFVKDVYPAEKDKIVKVMEKSREKINVLETSLMTIESQEDWARHNFEEVSLKVDAFLNDQIEALERKRQSLKDQLQKVLQAQKDLHETQKKSLAASLDTMKRSVEFAEQALKRGDEVGLIATKHEMIQQVTDINSATGEIQARGMISCNFEIGSPLNDAIIQKIAKIIEYDDEYTLVMVINKKRKTFDYASKDKAFVSSESRVTWFEIQSKRDKTSHGLGPGEVLVKIKRPGSFFFDLPEIKRDTFSYRPNIDGKYVIEILVNGRYLVGSPFTWKVKPATMLDVLRGGMEEMFSTW